MMINTMTMEQIEQRSSELANLINDEGADLEAINKEVAELEERKAQILKEAEERSAVIDEVLNSTETVEVIKEEEVRKKMEIKELRNTPEYINAYAEYVKGNDKEIRMLLSENATDGTIALPTIVEDRIWTDWDKLPILSKVRKVFVKGNYKIGYEASATGAFKHTEGTTVNANQEEQLTINFVEFISEYYKKFIRVSDVVMNLKGQAFLDYLFDEFGYQIGLALENAIVAEIATSSLSAKVTHALDGDAVLAGLGALSDEATNPIAIMSKSTYVAIKSLRTTAGNRLEDVFEGLEVLFNNNVAGVLVGDLDGVVVNFPNGTDFEYIVDNYSLAEQDLVKIVGKVMASMHLVRPNGFAVVKAS